MESTYFAPAERATPDELRKKKPVERTCAVTVDRKYKQVDLFFKVRCCPINLNKKLFLLLFLQDISKHQQWATMEKVFFHDINNILYGLLGRSELMVSAPEIDKNEYAEEIHRLSKRLSKEIEIQKCLFETEMRTYQPLYHETTLVQVVEPFFW